MGTKFQPVAICLLLTTGCILTASISDTQGDDIRVPTEFSLEAEQILLDLKKQLNFTTLTEKPIPIHRKDLPDDYIAYWLAVFDSKDYVIISSGPQTGDIKFRFQGSLPTVTSYLEIQAAEHNGQCNKFYLLTPDGVEMTCEDAAGHIIASTISEELFLNQTLVDPYESLAQQFVESRLCDMRVEWAKHGMEVTHKGEWMDEELLAEGQEEEESKREDDIEESEEEDSEGLFGTATKEKFNERAIIPGETQQLALGDSTMIKDVFIKYRQIRTSPDEELEALNATYGQNQLCKVVTSCSNDNSHVINKDVIQIDTDAGLAFMDLRIRKEAQTTLQGRELHFTIEIHRLNNAVVKYHYGVSYSANRQRRKKQTKPWSSWTTRSIKDEGYFPHYNQHKPTGSRCHVGCGPVAWAMIFGYFDRRSHYKTSNYGSGSQALFRCGADGTTGSNSCIAPKYNTNAIKGYTDKLNSEMKTFCLFGGGATLMGRMKRVSTFYKARQNSGSPNIVEKKTLLSSVGIKQKSIATWTRARINEGWPVVVGTSEGFFQWHYPVVTQYRSRSRKYRHCFIWCGKWKTETEYQMYTHQGWGGYKDGWRAMKIFFAIAARY